MEPLQITLTSAGLAIIANDGSAGFGPVLITQIGITNTPFTAASTLTAIPGELKRLAVNGEASGGDQLHIVAMDDTAETYAYSGLGIYLGDGTLFATYSQATPIAEKAEVSTSYLAIDIQLEAGQTANITFGGTNWINPPASTTRQGIVELATTAEAKSGNDATRVITPATAKAALLDWLGFTPLDASAFTAMAILAMLEGVDGSGTGLDADMLDGHHATDFLPASAFTAAAILAMLEGVDGSGTGLDADMLDGHHADEFALASGFDSGSNENGYWRKTPDGHGGSIIEQWGTATALDPWSGDLTFPIAFTDFESINIVAISSQNDNTASDGNALHARKMSLTTFQIGSDDNAKTVFWRAIGK